MSKARKKASRVSSSRPSGWPNAVARELAQRSAYAREDLPTKPYARRIGSSQYVVLVPVEEIEGEIVVHSDDLKRAELAIAARLAREGPVNGESFRFMRGAMGLTAKALGAELDVALETISRWETGTRGVDHAAWIALAGKALKAAGHIVEPLSAPPPTSRGPHEVRLPLGWRRELSDGTLWICIPWMRTEHVKNALMALGFVVESAEKVKFSGEDVLKLKPPSSAKQKQALEELAPIGVPLEAPIALPRRPEER